MLGKYGDVGQVEDVGDVRVVREVRGIGDIRNVGKVRCVGKVWEVGVGGYLERHGAGLGVLARQPLVGREAGLVAQRVGVQVLLEQLRLARHRHGDHLRGSDNRQRGHYLLEYEKGCFILEKKIVLDLN